MPEAFVPVAETENSPPSNSALEGEHAAPLLLPLLVEPLEVLAVVLLLVPVLPLELPLEELLELVLFPLVLVLETVLVLVLLEVLELLEVVVWPLEVELLVAEVLETGTTHTCSLLQM